MHSVTRQDPVLFRIACFAMAALTCVAAGTAYWQWMQPSTDFPTPLFSESYYRLASQAKTPADKIRWAQESLKVAPRRPENWLMLASAYQSQDGQVSARVVGALRKSYEVAPFSPDVSRWRLAYIFNSWAALPVDVRQSALAEARVDMTRWSDMEYMSQLNGTLRDENARLALGLMIAKANRAWTKGHS